MAVGLVAVEGCASRQSGHESADGAGVKISTSSWRPGDDVGWRRLGGVLRVTEDGCLYLTNELGRIDILWPADFTATIGADGLVEVKSPVGQAVARERLPLLVKGAIFNIEGPARLPLDARKEIECLARKDDMGVVVVVQSELPPLTEWLRPNTHVVTLYHCGVNPTKFDGRTWVVPEEQVPFDELDAPASFVGRGTMVKVQDDKALYVDESGIEIIFRPENQVPDSFCM
jgi:hypothetical protein